MIPAVQKEVAETAYDISKKGTDRTGFILSIRYNESHQKFSENMCLHIFTKYHRNICFTG